MLALLLLLLAVSGQAQPANTSGPSVGIAMLGRQRFVSCALKILSRSHRASNSYMRASRWPFISQTYMTHWAQKPERLSHTLKLFAPYNVMPVLVTQFDREHLRQKDVLCFNPAFTDYTWKECYDVKLQVCACMHIHVASHTQHACLPWQKQSLSVKQRHTTVPLLSAISVGHTEMLMTAPKQAWQVPLCTW